MGEKKLKFKELIKNCKFLTYQDQKCVHDEHPERLKVRSCKEADCPVMKDDLPAVQLCSP